MIRRHNTTEEAQSEILGLVLLLSLTMLAIGMILVFAEPAITEGREEVESGQITNEFSLLDSRLATSALGASEAQTTSLNVNDGVLTSEPKGANMTLTHNFSEGDVGLLNDTLEDPTLPEVLFDEFSSELSYCTSDPCDNWDASSSNIDETQAALNTTIAEIEMGKIEYTKNSESVSYEGGGVWRKDESSNRSVMVSSPEFHYEGQTLTLPVFNVTSNLSVSGNRQNFRVSTTSEPRRVFEENPVVGGEVRATVESEYYDAWAGYFDDRTQGNVTELDHENNTAKVTLVVPEDLDLDGGQAFEEGASGATSVFSDGFEENRFFLNPDDFMQDTLNAAQSNNDNGPPTSCIDSSTNDWVGDCEGTSKLTGSGTGLYYLSGDQSQNNNMKFDTSQGNISLVVDGDLSFGGNSEWNVVDEGANNRTEILVFGDLTWNGNRDLNTDLGIPNDGNKNSSDMIFFVESGNTVDWNGGGSGTSYVTLYAAGSHIDYGGGGSSDHEGAMISETIQVNGGGSSSVFEGQNVSLQLGDQGSTITYLHITENNVTVGSR